MKPIIRTLATGLLSLAAAAPLTAHASNVPDQPLVSMTLCSPSYTNAYGHCYTPYVTNARPLKLGDMLTATLNIHIGTLTESSQLCRRTPHILRLVISTIFDGGSGFRPQYYQWKVGTCYSRDVASLVTSANLVMANSNLAFDLSVDGWPVQQFVVPFNAEG